MSILEEFDLVVLGSGEAGKYLAWTLASQANSPGNSIAATTVNPDFEDKLSTTVEMIHLFHVDDPIARQSFFGHHYPLAKLLAFVNSTRDPHGLANFASQIEADVPLKRITQEEFLVQL